MNIDTWAGSEYTAVYVLGPAFLHKVVLIDCWVPIHAVLMRDPETCQAALLVGTGERPSLWNRNQTMECL